MYEATVIELASCQNEVASRHASNRATHAGLVSRWTHLCEFRSFVLHIVLGLRNQPIRHREMSRCQFGIALHKRDWRLAQNRVIIPQTYPLLQMNSAFKSRNMRVQGGDLIVWLMVVSSESASRHGSLGDGVSNPPGP
jgi:hypothetical protein